MHTYSRTGVHPSFQGQMQDARCNMPDTGAKPQLRALQHWLPGQGPAYMTTMLPGHVPETAGDQKTPRSVSGGQGPLLWSLRQSSAAPRAGYQRSLSSRSGCCHQPCSAASAAAKLPSLSLIATSRASIPATHVSRMPRRAARRVGERGGVLAGVANLRRSGGRTATFGNGMRERCPPLRRRNTGGVFGALRRNKRRCKAR